MQNKITLAIDALASAAFVEGGVSPENTQAARDLTEQRKRELVEAIAAPQCLLQIQEPEADIWPCVNIDVDERGNVTNAKLYSPGLPAGNHDVYPVRVPYIDEHSEAWLACAAELEKASPGFMTLGNMNGIECAVAAIRDLAARAASAQAAPAAVAVQLDANGIAPCPLCGSESKHVQAGVGGHRILCWNDDCECSSGYFCRKEEAITSWNARAALAATPAAAAPVVLPELMKLIEDLGRVHEEIGANQNGTCESWRIKGEIQTKLRALLAGVSAPAAQAVWDGKLPESLQRALNELRIDCKTDAVSSLEFEVRSVFEGMHTSLTTVKRMYHAAQKRLDSTDAAQPDPFAAPQAQADCLTCNDHGAVGNILTVEPCPDCTVPAIKAQADARDAEQE